ncbi:MAG: molybdenum cofactor guanylyltransferase [Thermodesulfobacteriota bacterium]
MKPSCSGIILAGGLNSRFSGRNKALMAIGARQILSRICEVFSDLFEEVILVTNDPLAYADRDIQVVTDLYDIRSSLTGLHAGLFYANCPNAFFTACDTPFLQKDVIRLVLDHIDSQKDIVVPRTRAGFEPLCAAYSTRCLPAVASCLESGFFKIMDLFEKVRVRTVDEALLREKDPELLSFFNVNTPDDRARAEALLAEKAVRGRLL